MSVCRILIVEDEAIVAMDLEGRLARMGYETVGRASSGEDATALALAQRPDLVLMDIRLRGEMDGIAAADEIRQSIRAPVIFLTAYSEDATLNRAKLVEPFGYIFKPIDDRELKSTIELALHKHRVDEEVRRLKCLYEMHTQVDQAVLRAQKPEELLSAVCRAAVENGSMELAWIGYLDPVTGRILPVAHFGSQSETLVQREYYIDDPPQGHDPTAAILEGQPMVFPPSGESFRSGSVAGSAQHPFRSCASFPIRFRGKVYYAFTLCTDQRAFFQEREIKLLKELVLDVAFALDKMEGDLQREILSEHCKSQSTFLSALLDALPFPAFYKDRELRYLGCNTAFENLLGVNREFLIGRTALEIWPPDLAKVYHAADARLLQSPSPQVYESAIEKPDGSRRLVRFHKATFDNADGTPGGIIGTVEDITERKAVEQSLLERLEGYRSLLDHAAEGMAFIDTESLRFVEFNDAAHRGLGFTREEFEQLSLLDIQEHLTPEEVRHAIESAVRGGTSRQEMMLRCKDGRRRNVHLSARTLVIRGSVHLGFSWQDVTE
ncbi:MAG: PAS domain S-box protein [Syntrophobacteraceae bacterium]